MKMEKRTNTSETWTGELTDIKAFLIFLGRAIVDKHSLQNTLVQMIRIDPLALNELARSTSGTLEIPGIRFRRKVTIASHLH